MPPPGISSLAAQHIFTGDDALDSLVEQVSRSGPPLQRPTCSAASGSVTGLGAGSSATGACSVAVSSQLLGVRSTGDCYTSSYLPTSSASTSCAPPAQQPLPLKSTAGRAGAGASQSKTKTASAASAVSAPAGATSAHEPLGVLTGSPRGQQLQVDILSTWGDPYYVGLSALEIFDERGNPIELADPHQQVRADPADINVLPEYGHDVRVVSNLFDGTLRTCDDAHLWLAPFTPGRRNFIFVDLGAPRTLSMVRVWNYNKSRIHSFRGARMLELRLDGVLIFRGEVNKSPGALHEVEKSAEPILFTMEQAVLSTIDEHDKAMLEFEPVAELGGAKERPQTAERHLRQQQDHERHDLRPSDADVPEAVRAALSRPRTAAFNAIVAGCQNAGAQQAQQQLTHASGLTPESLPLISQLQDYVTPIHPAGRVLRLVLSSTWGDPHYIGLNGIELLDPSGQPIFLNPPQISADPPSIASLPQLKSDPRTVDKLVDGTNASYDDRHMFLAPFVPGRSNHVRIELGRTERVAALRIWNYAKTSTRGVRNFEVLLDGSLIYQGSARPAPPRSGASVMAASDFVQTVLFTDNEQIIRAEAMNVYTHQDLEDNLQIFDNGQKLGGGPAMRPEEMAVIAAAQARSAGALRRPVGAASVRRRSYEDS